MKDESLAKTAGEALLNALREFEALHRELTYTEKQLATGHYQSRLRQNEFKTPPPA